MSTRNVGPPFDQVGLHSSCAFYGEYSEEEGAHRTITLVGSKKASRPPTSQQFIDAEIKMQGRTPRSPSVEGE
jgi:hypothetical protein